MNQTILLFGGESDERLVSVASAQAMAENLNGCNLWFWQEFGPIFAVEKSELLSHKNPFNETFKPKSSPIFGHIKEAINSALAHNATFVLALHGGAGENGYVQILLEEAGRAYTGSDALASRLAFDKVKTKEALGEQPIKMAPQLILKSDDNHELEQKLAAFFAKNGPSILKPICGGSSLGCIFLHDSQAIGEALANVRASGRDFLAEKIIFGRELTVGVIDTPKGLMALPPTEIIIDKNREFDYQGKYLGVGSQEITPADISLSDLLEAQRISLLAHKTLKLYGYSRSDLIMSPTGMYFLEVNTLPGLTKSSLVPQQLAYAGISMEDFLSEQVKLAQKRAALSSNKLS